MTPLRDGANKVHRSTVDENYEPKRAIDFSFFARVNSMFLRYSWLFTLLVGLLIAIGFDWKTPKAQFDDLRAELRANREATRRTLDSLSKRADTQEDNNSRVVDILEIFSIDLCLRRKADPYVYQRLRCAAVLSNAGGRP